MPGWLKSGPRGDSVAVSPGDSGEGGLGPSCAIQSRRSAEKDLRTSAAGAGACQKAWGNQAAALKER